MSALLNRKDKMHLSFYNQEILQFEFAKILKFFHFDVILHFWIFIHKAKEKHFKKLNFCVQFNLMIVYILLE